MEAVATEQGISLDGVENLKSSFNPAAAGKDKITMTPEKGTKVEVNDPDTGKPEIKEIPHQIIIDKSSNALGPGNKIKIESPRGRIPDGALNNIKGKDMPDEFKSDIKLSVPDNAFVLLPDEKDPDGRVTLNATIKTPFGDADSSTVDMKLVTAEGTNFVIMAIDKDGVGHQVDIDFETMSKAEIETKMFDKDGQEVTIKSPELVVSSDKQAAFGEQFKSLEGHFSEDEINSFKQLALDAAEAQAYPKETSFLGIKLPQIDVGKAFDTVGGGLEDAGKFIQKFEP